MCVNTLQLNKIVETQIKSLTTASATRAIYSGRVERFSRHWDMTSPSRSQIESSGSTSTSKAPSLSFSIENILGGKTLGKERRRADIPAGGPVTSLFKGAKDNSVPLPWLSYTRYCPPKIPSKYRIDRITV